MTRRHAITLVVLALMTVWVAAASAAVEATADILFETLSRVESRFRSYRAASSTLSTDLKRVEEQATTATERARSARLSGNRRDFEMAHVDLTEALKTQIFLQLKRMDSALEVFQASRHDLARILPRLRAWGGGTGQGEADRAHVERMLTTFRDFGQDLRSLALYFQRVVEAAGPDQQVQMKLAATAASLHAIQQALEAGRRSAAGSGGYGRAAVAVANALEALDATLPLLLLRRDVLLQQREKLRVANALAMSRLAASGVLGGESLNPLEQINATREELSRDLDRERRIDDLFEAEGLGPSAPPLGQVREAIESLRF